VYFTSFAYRVDDVGNSGLPVVRGRANASHPDDP
jgi:hypothetical protein